MCKVTAILSYVIILAAYTVQCKLHVCNEVQVSNAQGCTCSGSPIDTFHHDKDLDSLL